MKTKETSNLKEYPYLGTFKMRSLKTGEIVEHIAEEGQKYNSDIWVILPETSTREQALAWWNSLSDISIQMPSKSHLCKVYHGDMRIHKSLTGREIEEIWKKENSFMGTGLTQSEFINNCEKYFGGKPNQKQLPKELEGVIPRILTIEEKIENFRKWHNQKQYSQEEVDRLLDQQAARTTAQVLRSNQKQFKQFDESLFLAYIDKFNDNDKLRAFRILYKEVIKHYVIDSEIEHNKALGLHE